MNNFHILGDQELDYNMKTTYFPKDWNKTTQVNSKNKNRRLINSMLVENNCRLNKHNKNKVPTEIKSVNDEFYKSWQLKSKQPIDTLIKDKLYTADKDRISNANHNPLLHLNLNLNNMNLNMNNEDSL